MQVYAGGTSQYWGATEVGVRKVLAIEFNGASSKVYRDANATPTFSGNPGAQSLRGFRLGGNYTGDESFEGIIAAVRIKAGVDADYRTAESARLVSKWLG